jgi:hypothetical protein
MVASPNTRLKTGNMCYKPVNITTDQGSWLKW